MIKCNNKPLAILGYVESTLAQEVQLFIDLEADAPVSHIMDPNLFLALSYIEKDQYQYIVAFNRDRPLRHAVCDVIDSFGLDTIVYVSPNTENYLGTDLIGSGSWIGPKSLLCQQSAIGRHCLIHAFCLIAHYVTIGDRTILHSDVRIAGRTVVGRESEFNFGSKVGQGVILCDGVKLGEFSAVHKNISVPGVYLGYPTAKRVGDF